MKEKQYQPRQPYARDKAKRPRRSAHSSKLPYWIAKQPLVQKFNKLTRRRKMLLLGWVGASVLVVITLFTTVFFANTLGSKDRIMNRNKTGVTLLDQNNTEFYSFYNAKSSTIIPLDKIAPSARQAAIASEDKDFYKHGGFSVKGIGGAVWQNIRPNGLDNGGSTITQQLVKTALLSEERSFLRKYQELVLSVEIERRYSKDEILEMYLNSVYFGEGAFGIEDAAQTYFGIPAANLSIAQSSVLIGLLPAPSAYSPISGDAQKTLVRQSYVLGRMEEDGFITQAQKAEIKNTPLVYAEIQPDKQLRASHFALMVKQELEEKYGEEKIARSGYQVRTTLNLDTQNKSEAAVAEQVNRLSRSNVGNGSAVVIDPKTGEVRALVGSKDWYNESFGKFNIATTTRQPGSSFKPISYATGIENKDFSAATILHDKPTDFGGGYSPKNYDLKYRGDVTVRQSLANSLNVTTIEAQKMAGVDETVDIANKLGISTVDKKTDYGLSIGLGTAPAKLIDMTNAYATFANGGVYNKPTTIASITNKNKKEIFKHKAASKQVIDKQTAFIISSILSDATARKETFGSSLSLRSGRLAAVKTGTTEDYRDAWTIGYTPSIATGVWIGNNDNSPMSRIAGSSGAAPIWRDIMNGALASSQKEQFEQPAGLTSRSICRATGELAETNDGQGIMTEYFIPGTLPTATCNKPKPVEPTPEPIDTPEPTPSKPETPPNISVPGGGNDNGGGTDTGGGNDNGGGTDTGGGNDNGGGTGGGVGSNGGASN